MALEGGFRLWCQFEMPELQIFAERSCGHAP
jgi:hypothetical protein